jgi:hypothetical protein
VDRRPAKLAVAGIVQDVGSLRRFWKITGWTRSELSNSGVRSLVEQFDAKPSEIRQLLRGDLDPGRSRELLDEMRAAGLPT